MVSPTEAGREFIGIMNLTRQYEDGKLSFDKNTPSLDYLSSNIALNTYDKLNIEEKLELFLSIERACLKGICLSDEWIVKQHWYRRLVEHQRELDEFIFKNGLEEICII